MLCNIKPVPFHESDKHIFAKIPGGGGCPDPRSPLWIRPCRVTVLYAEHVKEPCGILSSFILYPCTIPVTTNRLLGASLRWATGSDDK